MAVMLVTGGSRGLGGDIARLAAERGWAIAINYVSDSVAADTVLNNVEKAGVKGVAVRADISEPDEVVRLFDSVESSLGPIVGLVNNAGISTGVGKIETLDVEQTRKMLAINVFGLFLCCRQAVKRMARCYGGQGGSIVNISSSAARSASPGNFVDYGAGKGAVDTLTMGLAKEQGSEGIRVNAVRPGFVKTEMMAELVAKKPAMLETAIANTPLGRVAEMRDVSHAVLWLMSEEARHITGAIIDISGGRSTQ